MSAPPTADFERSLYIGNAFAGILYGMLKKPVKNASVKVAQNTDRVTDVHGLSFNSSLVELQVCQWFRMEKWDGQVLRNIWLRHAHLDHVCDGCQPNYGSVHVDRAS